jgi:stage V sporulation protein G
VHITEVRIKLMEDVQERLQAFCSITIDGCFVIRDLKIIRGTKGPFVAMPSRKLTDRCPKCSSKNCLRAVFCSQCGSKLPDDRALKGLDGRAKLYADIAHPINSHCRELIQLKVLAAYDQELVLATQPGYVCRYDEFGDDGEFDPTEEWTDAAVGRLPSTGEAQRRVEPAAPATAGPHLTPKARGTSPSRVGVATATGDEEFGAGII